MYPEKYRNKQQKIKQQMEVLDSFLADKSMNDIDKEALKIYYKRNLKAAVKHNNFYVLQKQIQESQNEHR